MSVFGSLFTAVSGLNAQSQSIAMISNNIANVSTVGYKRTDAAFASLVTSTARGTSYSPGSVNASQTARVNQQGILQQSSSSTDMAISGNGFFIVKDSTTDPLSEPLYTRAGSFSEDSSGVLRNTSGFYLQGWPLDQDGNLPAAQADISSLVPVDVAFLGGLTQPTTTASLAMNLKAAETQGTYPVSATDDVHFSRGIQMYDTLGAGHDMTVNFRKIESPTATAIGNIDLSDIAGPFSDTAPFLATDTFAITVGAVGPTNITLSGSVADMLADINGILDPATNTPVAFASLDASGYLSIKARNPGDSITLADGPPAPGNALGATKLGQTANIGVTAAPAAPTYLTGSAPPNDPINTEGWWHVEFMAESGAVINSGYVNFTGAGQLNATEDADGKVLIDLDDIDWVNGSDLQDISFDIAGLNQFAGEYNVISSNQNGAELGLRTGISVDEDGYVTAQFSNGKSSRIFKVALATFANPNGLDELTGNVFRESDSSGSFNLREAGGGGAGKIASGALESSNVDLAEEFSKMIITQRAYSANTKVISTADQMTQELLQLR